MNSYGDLSDMALKNVLALADGEDPEDPDPGEDDGGIKVSWRYIDVPFQGKYASKVFCNRDTETKIYPCQTASYGNFLESSKDESPLITPFFKNAKI